MPTRQAMEEVTSTGFGAIFQHRCRENNMNRSLKRQLLGTSVAILLSVPILATPAQADSSDAILLKDASNNAVANIPSLTEPNVEFSKIQFNSDGTVTITTGTGIPITPAQQYDFGNLRTGG